MLNTRRRNLKLLVAAGSRAFVVQGDAWTPDGSKLRAPCTDVRTLRDHSLSELPLVVQSAVRAAVRLSIQAIINNKTMGLEGTKASNVPLDAIQLGRPTRGSLLYAVSWADSTFGVNGAIWIVEVFPGGAKNLVEPKPGQAKGFSLGGYGVEVLSVDTESYPEVMIASSGFRDGGGTEAEDTCVRKRGSHYEQVPCPASCHKSLNARVVSKSDGGWKLLECVRSLLQAA
jgi:hypothetical protein